MTDFDPVNFTPQNGLFRSWRVAAMAGDRALIDDGLIVVNNGVIKEVGRFKDLRSQVTGPVKDLGRVALAPGVFNCHTHLQISHAKGMTQLGRGFLPWLKSLLPLLPAKHDPAILDREILEMKRTGAAFVADIVDRRLRTVSQSLLKSGLFHVLFYEFLGFKPINLDPPPWLDPDHPRHCSFDLSERIAAAGHALYSTRPETLRSAKEWDRARNRPFSLHLAELEEETELLAAGRGALAETLRPLGLNSDFHVPGLSPVAYADELGLLDAHTLAVHCVHIGDADIEILKNKKVNVCLCPRSNALIGVGRAPLEKLRRAGINICLGTDSLASNHDLNLWSELIFLLENCPTHISLDEFLGWMTLNPARAFGLDGLLGSIEAGKLARFSVLPEELLEL